LPANVLLTAGLLNNRVYQNYTLNFCLSSNLPLLKLLTDAAELTFSRTPILKQLYYAHLLEELLFFQRTRFAEPKPTVQTEAPPLLLTLSDAARRAFAHPAVEGNHRAFNTETVRLDFGENELPAPKVLNQALFESYLVRQYTLDQADPAKAIVALLQRRFNLPRHFATPLILGNGVAPIFSALLELCAEEGRSLIIPGGSYGYFVAAAQLKNISVIILPTSEQHQFKIEAEQLATCLEQHPGAWIFINAPVVNPTGAIYAQSELDALLAVAEQFQTSVIIDSIFNGLEFAGERQWNLATAVERRVQSSGSRLLLMGGVSKEYAAGGLRFGYCWSSDLQLAQRLDKLLVHQPHFTLRYAVRKLFEAQLAGEVELTAHLNAQRELLSNRAARLSEVLNRQGWQVLTPQGGLFLVAKPEQAIEDDADPSEVADHICDRLFDEQNVAINNATWTGMPGYCRFVLSCNDADFELALQRLANFQLTMPQ